MPSLSRPCKPSCEVFSVLFPSDCRLCHTPLDNISRIPVCRECLAAIEPVRAPQCVVCGDRLVSAQLLMGDGRCTNCRDFEPEFERAVSFGEYEGGLRGLIHLLKYESVTPVAPVRWAACWRRRSRSCLPDAATRRPLLIPVPLHKSKRRTRGFNQAELIARAAAKRCLRGLKLLPGILLRQRDTISQVGLSREERIENVRDAFRVATAQPCQRPHRDCGRRRDDDGYHIVRVRPRAEAGRGRTSLGSDRGPRLPGRGVTARLPIEGKRRRSKRKRWPSQLRSKCGLCRCRPKAQRPDTESPLLVTCITPG